MIPPKVSHGEEVWRACSDCVAAAGVTGVGPLPPSMNTSASGVDHNDATVAERPTTATTV